MDYLYSIIMGFLQGFTEFLPISSSGHLILASKLFDIPNSLFFNVMLHVGSLIAVILCFRKQLWVLIKNPFSKKTLYLVVACVPTFILALVFKLFLPKLVDGAILPIGFALTAVILVLGEHFARETTSLATGKVYIPIVTGIVQGIAVLPGLSRSGSTISAMRLLGINRNEAAEFSFLLSVPIILASGVVECFSLVAAPTVSELMPTLIGMICALFSGYISIKLMLNIIKKAKLVWFAVYLIIPFVLSIIVI